MVDRLIGLNLKKFQELHLPTESPKSLSSWTKMTEFKSPMFKHNSWTKMTEFKSHNV